jgi:hypothetical protein
MLEQQQQQIILEKELATMKVADIVATFVERRRTAQKILMNYRLPHRKITFVTTTIVSTRPNVLHNNDRAEDIL